MTADHVQGAVQSGGPPDGRGHVGSDRGGAGYGLQRRDRARDAEGRTTDNGPRTAGQGTQDQGLAAVGNNDRGLYIPIRGTYLPIRGEGGVSSLFDQMAWRPLPGAKTEGAALAKQLPQSTLLTE